MKGLINIKNNDNKCFLWCHIRHLNPLKTHPEINLNYEGVKFPVSKKDYCKIEKENNIYINVFSYENNLIYPVYVYRFIADIKVSTDLCVIKQKIKIKNTFANVVYNVLVVKKVLIKHKKNCLIINGKQSVRLKRGSIRFKNYFKQLAVPFKIYADFECLLKGVKSSDKNNSSYTRKYQDHIPCSFAYKVVCIENKFSKRAALYTRRNAVYRFIEAILKEYNYCKKVIKRHFNKNLIISAEDEERFQLGKNCWICIKLFDVGDDKVRDH